jgi:hypothetical protein
MFVPSVVTVLMLIAVVAAVNIGEARRIRQTGPDFEL